MHEAGYRFQRLIGDSARHSPLLIANLEARRWHVAGRQRLLWGLGPGHHRPAPVSFAEPFGWMRNEELVAGAGFLADFGFLASRLLRF
ncbi:hypothetical protein ACFQX4_19735 [Roseomonas sp. GCM10028921]